MKYRVLLTDECRQNVRINIDWYSERSASAAEGWYSGFQNLLSSLDENPQRYPLAPESRRFPIELRHVNYGSGRRTTHRVIFAIRADAVVVYAVRHASQGEWRPD
jgi:hypothetical protein